MYHWKLLKISQNGSKWTELAIFVNSTQFDHTNCAQLTGIDIEKCIVTFFLLNPKRPSVLPEIYESCSKLAKMDQNEPNYLFFLTARYLTILTLPN